MAWELMCCLDSELQYQASPTVNWIVRCVAGNIRGCTAKQGIACLRSI